MIEVLTNYYELRSTPNWTLYQYHVDFEPSTESKRLRIGLVAQHNALFANNKAFDGTTLFSLTRLENELTEVESERKFDQVKVKLRIKRVAEVAPGSPDAIRLLNIVFRRCLTHCKFKEFGKERSYFDFEDMHELHKYDLRIAPGFKTTMALYGSGKILLCAEVAHKLFNMNNVLTSMNHIYKREGAQNYQAACIAELVGQTVMTMYNKKTYRIDDIAWQEKPTDSFETRPKKGETEPGRITFVQYYRVSLSLLFCLYFFNTLIIICCKRCHNYLLHFFLLILYKNKFLSLFSQALYRSVPSKRVIFRFLLNE